MIEVVRIDDPSVMQNQILQERVIRGRNGNTQEFLILREDIVAGLLIYEGGRRQHDFIYEIFVLQEFRGCGIGAWALAYGEQIAVRFGKAGVRLIARALSLDSLSDDDLIAWYGRRGYVQSATESGMLEKLF